MGKLMIPSPFGAHGLCYNSSGFVAENHRPTFALRSGTIGNLAPEDDYVKSEAFAWYQERSSSYNPSQIVCGNYLYTLYDQEFLTCHDAKTGEEVYGKQRFSPSCSFTASPSAFNGRLFLPEQRRSHLCHQAGAEFRNPRNESI